MTPQQDPADDSMDEELAELLSALTDRVAQGVAVDLEAVCREHPHLADQLRGLWGAVLIADVAGGRAASDPLMTTDANVPSGPAESVELPFDMGDYRLIEEIGRGGMGVVYRAQQRSLGREVAVKMMAHDRADSAVDRSRFDAEASAAAQLEHPGIVPIYEVGSYGRRAYFSMQLVDGPTLSEKISRGPMQERAAAQLVSEVARAVHYAHERGVCHRDIKPSNILINAEGQPLVSDFGLAKQIRDESGVTRTGAVVGTPSYMSPEQASGRGEQVGPRSDVYSLGCVLYHALVGRPPLVADSAVELVLMVLEQEPLPPRSLRPVLDRDLEMIVIRCLQKPADLRYQSAAELASDLDAFLNSEPVSARSGRFGQIVARALRETHHANVLENWGLLWMWHSLVLFVACSLTWWLQTTGQTSRQTYTIMWTLGLGAWAAVFWFLRRRLGPVTFVERQIAHVWGASILGIGALFPLEYRLGLEPLSLSPLLGIIAAMVFIVKAAILSGAFYIQAIALMLTAGAMAMWPQYGHLIFGVVSALAFFVPGLKYFRQRQLREGRAG